LELEKLRQNSIDNKMLLTELLNKPTTSYKRDFERTIKNTFQNKELESLSKIQLENDPNQIIDKPMKNMISF
jgi:hypothetical protein